MNCIRLMAVLSAMVATLTSGLPCNPARDGVVWNSLRTYNEERLRDDEVAQRESWSAETGLSSQSHNETLESMRPWRDWARRQLQPDPPCSPTLRRALDLMSRQLFFDRTSDGLAMGKLMYKLSEIYRRGGGEDEASEGMKKAPLASWMAWQSTGVLVKPLWPQLVTLANIPARDSGFHNLGEAWRAEQDIPHVEQSALGLWRQVERLYRMIHRHARKRLQLSGVQVGDDGYLPAHQLGSLWADNWAGLGDVIRPFPGEGPSKPPPVTSGAAKVADELFQGMGLPAMTETFWKKSILEKKQAPEMECHPVSFDMAELEDFRIKTCIDGPLEIILHELGHIQYFMAYRALPPVFRNSPGPALHEAVGDMAFIALEAGCNKAASPEQELNLLADQAFRHVVKLPWSLAVDLWRYREFAESNVNVSLALERWWDLRRSLQGVKPPPGGLNNKFFDPGTKYHIVQNLPYLSYYFSTFIQYQLLESLCQNNASVPLHRCCLRGNKMAGQKLRRILQTGATVPLPTLLGQMTGSDVISPGPLLRYFRPLFDWLTAHT